MTKRISIKVKAYQSNGFSRACVEGYIKGYKRAKKDMKDDNRWITNSSRYNIHILYNNAS